MDSRSKQKNVAVWFEIPAQDFDRAAKFYENIFESDLRRESFGGAKMAVFPYEQPGVSGAVMEAPQLAGKDAGTVVYLNCDGRLDRVVERVEGAGGQLLTPRIKLPGDMGAFVHIRDSEGNRVGLHARH